MPHDVLDLVTSARTGAGEVKRRCFAGETTEMHETSLSMNVSKQTLSPCAISVLGQLFVEGPTLDNNLASKAGRCALVDAGLAFFESGWASLTPDGLRLATEWDLESLYARRDRRWYLKARS